MPGSSIGDVVAVSGGADSVYLLCRTLRESKSAIVAHLDHGARGKDSDADREFVVRLARSSGVPVEVRAITMGKSLSGFEKKARNARYAFLLECGKKHGAERILVAHTADDQVETILMRVLEGAGISGLKGIPRKTDEGIERPLLDTWREDILKYLRKHKIPYRVDRSNFDTRFERNWIRHVLIPLLEKRYGRSVKKRIFALGERFREIDELLTTAARRWVARNVTGARTARKAPGREETIGAGGLHFQRKPFGRLPSALRKTVLQRICFERIGFSANERLLESMDRLLVAGRPSGRLNIGRGAVLRCRYDQAILQIVRPDGRPAATKRGISGARTGRSGGKGKTVPPKMTGPGRYELEGGRQGPETRPGFPAAILWDEKGRIPAAGLKRLADGERAAAFDADALSAPLTVRPLGTGDRIRPFGLEAEKKVKEILIDRKVPREERWGRPVVCDAEGRILWIPGVVRSSHAPVTGKTRRTAVLRAVLGRKRPLWSNGSGRPIPE